MKTTLLLGLCFVLLSCEGSANLSGQTKMVSTNESEKPGNIITPEGAKAAQLGLAERQKIGNDLLDGKKNISVYNRGICFDVVAYTKYMLGADISPQELFQTRTQGWLPKFNFPSGVKWTGGTIPRGKAVGFFRVIDKTWFHAAISTGNGTEVRSINSLELGYTWLKPANLKTVMGHPNPDGTFNFDGTKIEIYLSNL